MENILSWLSSKVVPPAVIVLFLGSTVATSSLAGMKLFSPAGPSVQGVNAVEQVSALDPLNLGSSGASGSNGVSRSSGTSGASVSATTTIKASPTSPAASVMPQPKSNATASTVTGCIVTLFGKQYDVTSLRTSHSGGDIFKCGTDMSATYQSQHGTNVSRMQAYLVTSSSPGSSTGSSTGTSGTSGAIGTSGTSTGSIGSTGASGTNPPGVTYEDDDEDEPESEDERERYIEENEREAEKQRLESEREQAKQAAESKAEEER